MLATGAAMLTYTTLLQPSGGYLACSSCSLQLQQLTKPSAVPSCVPGKYHCILQYASNFITHLARYQDVRAWTETAVPSNSQTEWLSVM